MSKLILLAVMATIAAVFVARRRRDDGLRGRVRDAGDRLKDAEHRVEDTIRS